MTLDELQEFANWTGVEINEVAQWSDTEQKELTVLEFSGGHLLSYPYYQSGKTAKLLKDEVFEERVTPEILWGVLTEGKDVEQITRVTGYYGKVKNFNPGKIGELRDRFKSGDLRGTKQKQPTA